MNGRLLMKHDDYFHQNRPHRHVDYWQDLATLQVPLLIVRADNSTYLSDGVAHRMVEVTPDVHLVSLPGTGHRVPVDNPTDLARTMIEFLKAND